MPCFILPAYLICITFGADYWVGDNVVRRWSYCISTIISVVLLLPYLSWMMSYYGTSTALGFLATFLLPIIPILYGIRLVRMGKKKNQKADKAVETPQSMHTRMNLRKVIRVLCLLSICCVLFENSHNAILTIYYHLTIDGITLIPGLITFPLSILSAILLAKFVKAEFVKAEFVQWKPSLDWSRKELEPNRKHCWRQNGERAQQNVHIQSCFSYDWQRRFRIPVFVLYDKQYPCFFD